MRRAALFVARRAALRVLPIAWAEEIFWERKGELTLLPVLWASSVAEIARKYPTSETATDAAYTAASDAAYTAATDAAYTAATDAAANAAANAAHAIWKAVRQDATYIVANRNAPEPALWHDAKNPLEPAWQIAKSRSPISPDEIARQETGDWTFWVHWYEAHVKDDPLPLELLKDIAELPEEIWTKKTRRPKRAGHGGLPGLAGVVSGFRWNIGAASGCDFSVRMRRRRALDARNPF